MLKHFENPEPQAIGNNEYEFLNFLGGPASILLTGKDSQRCRVFVTLLHGNEPSGTKALFQWLKSGRQPAMNMLCIVASVAAAELTPAFSHRVISPQRDLNRCFKSPYDDEQGQLANEILQQIKNCRPEAVIDMHNTSGSGPAFAVATFMDDQHDALTSLFTQRIVVTNLRLGALMEISEYLCPTVTIECGGREDDEAHQIAWEGLCRYFSGDQVLQTQTTDWGLEILRNPVRLELAEHCRLTYNQQPQPDYQLTVKPDIEHLNAGVTAADTCLGWVKAKQLTDIFVCKNSQQACVLNEMFYIDNNALMVKQDLKLFMITNNPTIAKMDCLLYAVKSDGQELVVT